LNRRIYITCVLFIAFLLGASHAAAQQENGMLVTTNWLSAHLNDPSVVVLHVGLEQSAYDAGHVPGARFLAFGNVITTRNGVPNQLPAANDLKAAFERLGVGDTSHVVIYGDTPLIVSDVYFALDYLGHGDRASILDGGLYKWKAEKRPASKVQPQVKAATLTVTAHPELLVDMPAVQKLVAGKKIVLIDGRAPDQFSGANPGDGIKRGGHIPGAKNVFWMQTVTSKEDPTLKPVEQIRALYEAAGLKPGEAVVVYCRTGPIATHEYFTLKLTGFHPQVYNGSFMEWSNAGTTPVETGT
jgi:thiosulfate/3-mercaptopyruvate sulfurtransferase